MTQFLLETHGGQLVLLAAALVAGCYVCLQLILIAMALRWPTVDGEIVGAYLIQRGLDARSLVDRVTYRYSVAGQTFVNDRVRFGPQYQRASIVPATGYPGFANSVARRYPVGRRVRVRYNPRRPHDSVLYAQPNSVVVCLFVGAVLAGCLAARALIWRQ